MRSRLVLPGMHGPCSCRLRRLILMGQSFANIDRQTACADSMGCVWPNRHAVMAARNGRRPGSEHRQTKACAAAAKFGRLSLWPQLQPMVSKHVKNIVVGCHHSKLWPNSVDALTRAAPHDDHGVPLGMARSAAAKIPYPRVLALYVRSNLLFS